MAGPQGWAIVATAPNQITAEMWQELLAREGIPALAEPEAFSFLGPSPYPCRLLVPQARLGEARAALEEYTDLPPEDSR